MKEERTQKTLILAMGSYGNALSSEALGLLAEHLIATGKEEEIRLYDGISPTAGEGLLARRFASMKTPPLALGISGSTAADLDIPLADLLMAKASYALVDIAPREDHSLLAWIEGNLPIIQANGISLLILVGAHAGSVNLQRFENILNKTGPQAKLLVAHESETQIDDILSALRDRNPSTEIASFPILLRSEGVKNYVQRYSLAPVFIARDDHKPSKLEDLLPRGRVVTAHRREMASLALLLKGAMRV